MSLCVCAYHLSRKWQAGSFPSWEVVGQGLWCTREKRHPSNPYKYANLHTALKVPPPTFNTTYDWNLHTRKEARRWDWPGVNVQSRRYQRRLFIHGTGQNGQRACPSHITRRKKAGQKDQYCFCASRLCHSLCTGMYYLVMSIVSRAPG